MLGHATPMNPAGARVTNGVRATALIQAASYGHAEIVRLLVDAGADMDVQDRDGRTALEHTRRAGFAEIEEILRDGHRSKQRRL